MIGGHFLGEEDRAKLIALARDGLAAALVGAVLGGVLGYHLLTRMGGRTKSG